MGKFAPYLMFKGNCEESVNFYKECFNGEIGLMGRYGDSLMEVQESHKDKKSACRIEVLGRLYFSL